MHDGRIRQNTEFYLYIRATLLIVLGSAILDFRPSECRRQTAKGKNDDGEHKNGVHRHSAIHSQTETR